MNSTGYSCVPGITKHRRHVRGKSCEQIEANVYADSCAFEYSYKENVSKKEHGAFFVMANGFESMNVIRKMYFFTE